MKPLILATLCIALLGGTACSPRDDFESQVEEYLKKFPYQDTYNYAVRYTDKDPARLNIWVVGQQPALVKAGQDKIVRMNNDTFYKLAFALLSDGPVVLASSTSSPERFSSFQLMDDHNVNFHNVIRPDGRYVLYHGAKPEGVEGELIESPSALVAIIVRVEVKNKEDKADLSAAKTIFNGITISGPEITTYPTLDLLSGFDEAVAEEAEKRMDELFVRADFSDLVAGPGDVPGKVSYLQLASGTKGGWGGPVTSHSAYETIFTDAHGETLDGSKGTYTITTEAPPVGAFWSVTVYDTKRGGFLHPNKDDRYHINNTSAVPNEDGTYTFTFKTKCEPGDKNCLEVPANAFDFAARYYLPETPITSGEWRMPRPELAE